MKQLFFLALLALLLCGCMGNQKGSTFPSASAVQVAVEAAAGSTRKAAQRTAAAKGLLRVAVARSQALRVMASAAERPLVDQMQTALEETQTELDAAQDQLNAAGGALADSSGQLDGVQRQLGKMGSELGKAQEEASRLKAGRDFWRACAWRLALVSLALGLWTFRKPLLALAGL